MDIITVLLIVWLHFFADFVCQTRTMATNKSSSNYWLGIHVLVYMIPFAIVFNPTYACVNGVLHFITDYITSRISAKYYQDGKIGAFFNVIGFDQAVHFTCLFVTYYLIM